MGEPKLDAENASLPKTGLTADEARDAAIALLFTSDDQRVPNEVQKAALTRLNDTAIEFGTALLASGPKSRELSLALTHLEDALIRGRRSIYATLA